jgi:hypothetical protein
MKDTFEKVEGLTDHLKEYINTQIDLAKLNIIEKASLVISNIIAVCIVVLFFLLVLVFGSIAGAWALSEWIGKPYSGYLIVAGVYLLLGIIVWVTRSQFFRFPIMNALIKQLHKNEGQQESN